MPQMPLPEEPNVYGLRSLRWYHLIGIVIAIIFGYVMIWNFGRSLKNPWIYYFGFAGIILWLANAISGPSYLPPILTAEHYQQHPVPLTSRENFKELMDRNRTNISISSLWLTGLIACFGFIGVFFGFIGPFGRWLWYLIFMYGLAEIIVAATTRGLADKDRFSKIFEWLIFAIIGFVGPILVVLAFLLLIPIGLGPLD